jgi:hypothetical protein
MKYLDKHPSSYEPRDKEVEELVEVIDKRYKVKVDRKMSYVMIDDKVHYLSGFLFNKGRIVNKMFLDIKYYFEEIGKKLNEPSLRKAIKTWIDLNSKPIKESFKNTDEEILMFFTDYYDESTNNFKIENVLLHDNKEVVKETPYLKNPSRYKKAKLVTVRVDKPDGPLYNMSNFSTSLETLQNILSDLERFYDMAGEEVNYKIMTDYMGIHIQFLVIGETVSDDASKVKIVDELLKEFKEMFKRRGFRPSNKGNWVEVKTTAKKSRSMYGDYSIDLTSIMNRINDGQITLQNLPRESYRDLVEWYNKVISNGLSVDILGGDHQFVIRLKNNNQ